MKTTRQWREREKEFRSVNPIALVYGSMTSVLVLGSVVNRVVLTVVNV